jgi:uncharacterized protein YbgA (DUF1722 family)
MNPMVAESQRRLDSLGAMLAELHRLQNARLSSRLPEHLTEVPNASEEEKELGNILINLVD